MDCDTSKENLDKLSKELKKEQLSHLETKSKLFKTTEKLEIALAEIQQLNREQRHEKDSFKKAFNQLKDTAFEQKQQALMLKEKYQEVEKLCRNQDAIIHVQEKKIEELSTELANQKKSYRHQLTDQEIHLQQERYLAQNYLRTRSDHIKLKKNT